MELDTFPPFPFATCLDSPTPFGDYRDDLAAKGYAVIKGVVSRDRAAFYRGKIVEWLEARGNGFKYGDLSTYDGDHLPPMIFGGMYTGMGVSHEDWAWELRTEPGVISSFAKLWGTDELLCSFDAIGAQIPNRKDLRATPRWPHVDQSPCRRGFYIMQGLVNLEENGPNDGGLMILTGASKLFEQFFDAHGRNERRTFGPVDYFSFTPEEEEWFLSRGCSWTKVCASAGDMIVWDSRSLHYSVLPTGDVPRFCIYVCQSPAALAHPSDLQSLQNAFENTLRTTHVTFGGHVWTPPFSPVLRDGKPDPKDDGIPIKKVQASDRVLQLAGVKSY